MIKLKDLFKVMSLFAVSLLTLFAFQNCGNVKIQEKELPSEPSVQAKGISGKICTSDQAVSSVSRFQLNHFVILNLTAVTKDSAIEPDSNVNGVADRLENNLNEIPPIKISNSDLDSDGIPDFIEEIRGMKQSENDLFIDGSDQDGINNLEELITGTDPTSTSIPFEQNLYAVAEISADPDCDQSQQTYQFNIENLQRVSVASFNDSVNSGETSLSHEQDENVFLIYAHLLPERVTQADKKIFKIFKIKKEDKDFFLDLKISDYSNLPISQ